MTKDLKIKIKDAAAYLGLKPMSIVYLVKKLTGMEKKPSASITDTQMNIVLEYITQKKQVKSFDEYFSTAYNEKTKSSITGKEKKKDSIKSEYIMTDVSVNMKYVDEIHFAMQYSGCNILNESRLLKSVLHDRLTDYESRRFIDRLVMVLNCNVLDIILEVLTCQPDYIDYVLKKALNKALDRGVQEGVAREIIYVLFESIRENSKKVWFDENNIEYIAYNEIHYKDGSVYYGEWKRLKKEGKGRLVFDRIKEKRFAQFEGDFKDNVFEGQGKITYTNGNVYVGEVSCNMPNGFGSAVFGANRYNGFFLDGKRSGEGEIIYRDGSRYKGSWKKDKRDGKGTLLFADGSVYDGNWLEGMRSGDGTLIDPYGNVFTGRFFKNRKNGKGVLKKASGEIYTGTWTEDRLEGYGICEYQNGDKYEGEFKNGNKHGAGIFTSSNGDVYIGEFKDDKKNGFGRIQCTDGSYYIGGFKNGKRHGAGKKHFIDNSEYYGNWAYGKMQGYGELKESDGTSYKGLWKKGKRDGKGVCTYPNYDKKSGIWKNNKLIG